MKSMADLKALKEKALHEINLRTSNDGYRIVVGMATCGIAAGARPVMNSFVEEVNKRKISNAVVSMTGCIGVCRYEPVVEVYNPDGSKVTYVHMTAEKAVKVVAEHIVNGHVVEEYTIGNAEK